MDSASEFETVRKSLAGQAIKEIKNLREYLNLIDPDRLENDSGFILADAVEKIVFVYDGLKKIAHVQEYMDAWEENGDPPQLDYKEENSLLKGFVTEERA